MFPEVALVQISENRSEAQSVGAECTGAMRQDLSYLLTVLNIIERLYLRSKTGG